LQDVFRTRQDELGGASCILLPDKSTCELPDDVDSDNALTMICGCIPCDDEIVWGARQGKAGDTRVAHLMCNNELALRRPVLWLVECASEWQPHELCKTDGSPYSCIYGKVEVDKSQVLVQ